MSNQRFVNSISGRLSLRPPQRQSLEILDRITEIAPPRKGADVETALEAIRAEYPSVTDFEREFPSVCFALATGVGKTRLMGAFVSYLHLAHGFNNFFVLAPNLTIYNKLITDFTPNTPKYVLTGISEFAVSPPVITTGDNFERQIASGGQLFPTTINIRKFGAVGRHAFAASAKRWARAISIILPIWTISSSSWMSPTDTEQLRALEPSTS
jgi:type III restriction enzyme